MMTSQILDGIYVSEKVTVVDEWKKTIYIPIRIYLLFDGNVKRINFVTKVFVHITFIIELLTEMTKKKL